MSMHARVSGTWREIQEVYARVSGAWREVQEGWVKDGGTWRQFYQAAVVTLTNHNILGGWFGEAGIQINADGTIDESLDSVLTQINSGSDWVVPNSAAPGSFEVRCMVNSGTLSTSSGTGTWLPLTSNRQWLTTSNLDITLEVRRNGGSVLDSATYNIV